MKKHATNFVLVQNEKKVWLPALASDVDFGKNAGSCVSMTRANRRRKEERGTKTGDGHSLKRKKERERKMSVKTTN